MRRELVLLPALRNELHGCCDKAFFSKQPLAKFFARWSPGNFMKDTQCLTWDPIWAPRGFAYT